VPQAFTGTGDPSKSLALLWRRPEAPARRRGPQASVGLDAIVEAAVALADAQGLAALSMRSLATTLDVGAMTLYSYVPGKAELVDVMYDLVLGEMYAAGAPSGPHWRDKVEAVAWENWRLYQRHPWAVHVAAGRPPLGPGLLARYEVELQALDGTGVADVERDVVVTLLGAFTRGLAAAEVERAEAEAVTGITEQQWWQATEPYFKDVFDPDRFPTAARVGLAAGEELQAAVDPTRTFATGLRALIDGIGLQYGLD
jgi:AcrR family transcriptional regulator